MTIPLHNISNQTDIYGIRFFTYGLLASFVIASSVVHLDNNWEIYYGNNIAFSFALLISSVYLAHYTYLYNNFSISTFSIFNITLPNFIQNVILSIGRRNKFPKLKEVLLFLLLSSYKIFSFVASYCIIHLTLLIIDYVSNKLYSQEAENMKENPYSPSDITREFTPLMVKLIDSLNLEINISLSYFFVSFFMLSMPSKYTSLKANLNKTFKIFITVTGTIIALPIITTIFTDMVTK